MIKFLLTAYVTAVMGILKICAANAQENPTKFALFVIRQRQIIICGRMKKEILMNCIIVGIAEMNMQTPEK